MIRRLPFFYGWFLVCITVVSMTLIYGVRHSFSVFFPPILDEFGWSRGSTAAMLSLSILIYGFMAPLAGNLGDRWKPRQVMPIGVVLLGLSTAGCALAGKLWHFYLLFGILGPIGTAFSGWPLFGPALSNWFAKRRGVVIGIGQMGGGLSFAFGMVAEIMISHVGWRSAYLMIAGILVALLLPIYLFLVYYRPEDIGLSAYGAAERPATRGPSEQAAPLNIPVYTDWTLSAALSTYQLWLLISSQLFFWGIGCYMVLAHQIKFVTEAGYGNAFAASVFGLFGVLFLAGQASSSISDWIGREVVVFIASTLSIGAIVALVSVTDTSEPWLLYVYAIGFGYGVGLYSPTIFAGTADIFHGKDFGAIAGLILSGMGVGGTIGPWLGGHIYDVTGSYSNAFLLSMVCFFLAWVTYAIAAPRNAYKLRAKLKA
jgi:MFS family permease